MRLQMLVVVFTGFLLSACTMSSEFVNLADKETQNLPLFTEAPTHGAFSNSLTTSPVITWPSLSVGEASSFEYAIGTEYGLIDVKVWTATSILTPVAIDDLTLDSGETYYISLRAIDSNGNPSEVVTSTGWLVDADEPSTPASIDDGAANESLISTGTIAWTASTDLLSGLSHYQIALGTTSGGTDVQNWVNVGNVTSYQIVNLNLVAGTTYYASVRAIDLAGNIGQQTSGDGWIAGPYCADKGDWLTYNESGAGTQADPYLICNAAQLASISGALPLQATYRLMGDIDLAPYYAAPNPEFQIGSCGTNGCASWDGISSFRGVFDGNGFSIDNFSISGLNHGAGFFAVTQNALIKNLSLSNLSVSGVNNLGGMIGTGLESTVLDSHVSGTVTGSGENVGGFTGFLLSSKITGATFEGTVASPGQNKVGGLIGWSESSVIGQSQAKIVSVSGREDVGGIVGRLKESSLYSSSAIVGSAPGLVSATGSSTGGIAGTVDAGRISNSFSRVEISSSHDHVGGAIGAFYEWGVGGLVINSYATGNVTGRQKVGGFIGALPTLGMVMNSYSTGNTTGTSSNQIGYFVGELGVGGGLINSYYLSTSNCTVSGGGACGVAGSSHDDISDFYVATNAPMSSWDGVSNLADGSLDLWEFRSNDHAISFYENESSYTVPFTSGEGTTDSPYLISTVEEFNWIGQNPRWAGAHFSLEDDLDFDGESFKKIGGEQVPFSGSFSGNGHTISNITYSAPSEYDVGVFGVIGSSGNGLSNLSLNNINIEGGAYTGGVVGFSFGRSMSDIQVVGGTVTGNANYTGGVVGYICHGNMDRISSTAQVSGGLTYTGGIAGYAHAGSLRESFTKDEVSGGSYVGGLIGEHLAYGIYDSYTTGDVTGTGDYVGGLSGLTGSHTQDSYAVGAVSGANHVGGIAGRQGAYMYNLFATGEITATGADAGRLFGSSNGNPINASYYLSASLCTINGIDTCNFFGTGSIADVADLYDRANAPLSNWDFSKWTEVSGSYPKLKWEP